MCQVLYHGVDDKGREFYGIQCSGCDPDAAAERLALFQMQFDEQEREDFENFKRHEPNRHEFKVKSKHIQLGHRVNRIPSTAQRF